MATEHAGDRGIVVVGSVLCIAGFVLPWMTFGFSTYDRSYSPNDLPFLDWAGIVWLVVLLTAVGISVVFRSRVVATVTVAMAVVSSVCALTVDILMWRLPRLVPLDLLPEETRRYVPSMHIAIGAILFTVGCLVLGIWAVRNLVRTIKASGPQKGAAAALDPPAVSDAEETHWPFPSDDDIWSEARW